MQKFFQRPGGGGGGGPIRGTDKRGGGGGGSLCEVLHPTLAGGRMAQGGGENAPPCPPLNTTLNTHPCYY